MTLPCTTQIQANCSDSCCHTSSPAVPRSSAAKSGAASAAGAGAGADDMGAAVLLHSYWGACASGVRRSTRPAVPTPRAAL
jgi:hypothetical protein